MNAQRTLLLGLALGLLGCASSNVVPEPTEARLELGTGTARFVPITDGAELEMIHGAQGGWHVWVSVRAEGITQGTGTLEIEHGPADGSAPMQRTRVGVMFDPADAQGRRASLGWTAIFDNPSCQQDRLYRIRVTLTTASGQRLSDERDVMPRPGMYPPSPCGS
jgi:hypothetical protein